MHIGLCLVLSLFWFVVEIYSQPTAPYVSFRGVNLPNHGYVDLSLVGDPETSTSSGDPVQCHTDIQDCCSDAEPGMNSGNWYFPDGLNVPFTSNEDADIHMQRAAQRVELRRRDDALSPSGIYRCEIMVNGDDNIRERETVYVGIYGSGGTITISGGVEFAMISDDEFTLTCISTGGPATTVTWTRNMEVVTEGTETVLDDPETAQYTNTLTVTGRLPGLYTCTVTNEVTPDGVSASITVQVTSAPTNVMAEQEGPTSIRVTWTPSSGATGYIISYTDGSSSDSEPVSGGNSNQEDLTGLQNGATYTMSIVATSETSLHSESVVVVVPLVPNEPIVTEGTVTATSITLSGSVPSGSVVDNYAVMWQRDTSLECPDDEVDGSDRVTGDFTGYTINGLEEDSSYIITVTVFNDAGSSEDTVTVMTEEAAPSAPPDSVSISEVTSSSITVQWEMVPCIHRNGDTTGYSVRYVGGSVSDMVSVSSGNAVMTTITGLRPSTIYSIQVRAVNSMGNGDYSDFVIQRTADVLSISSVVPSSPTDLIISWTLDDGVMVESYTITYTTTDTECVTDSGTSPDIAGSARSHELMDLEEGTEYSITVTATLSGGGTGEDDGMGTTMEDVPSTPPGSVSATSTSSSITVQWEMVPCIHRNGDITGYSVQYEVVGSGSPQTVPVSGGDNTMTIIHDVESSTTYSIQVAAVNGELFGPYSTDSVIVETPQTVFLSLRGDVIPNHGYVVISDIGTSETDTDSLLCITNGVANTGDTPGNWFAPDGTRVNALDVPGVRRNRGAMVVRLFRYTATGPPAEGMYHCMVQDATSTFQTVYVGLYNSGGGVVDVQSVGFTLDNEASPQFTLTCISTGGPATTVTWTRDSQAAAGERRSEVVNGVTAQYTNTLTVTGRLGGLYVCNVANEVTPAGASESLTVTMAAAPNNVMAVQEPQTSIHLYWTPPTPLGDTTGYIISYTGGSSDNVTVSGGSIDNYLLTGLVMDSSYTISIVAISEHLPSDVLEVEVTLVSLPYQPSVSVTSITATSISLSWSVPSDSVVTSYEVIWRETDSGATEMTSGSLTDTSYTIEQLDSTTIYTITVTATNQAGNTDSLPVIISTGSDSCPDECRSAETDTAAVIGGVVVAIVLILSVSLTVIVIVVLVLRSRRGQYTTGPSKREAMPPPGATNTMELSKFSEEPTYVDPDVIPTSSNEAYHTVSQTGGTTTDYEAVSDPHTVPPSTTHSSQPPTTGDYEQV